MAHAQHQYVTGWTGWVMAAGFLMAFSGILHVLFGIGGIFGQDWYVYTANSAWLFDSSVWGWTMVAVGALLIGSASLLLAGNMVGRIVGAILATASLLANIALFAAAPFWSGLAIVVDVLIIYAIVAHGGEMKHLRDTMEPGKTDLS